MKHPNYQKILNKKADNFINDYVTQDLSPTMKEAERASYKVGFIDCYNEFDVPKMIEALTETRQAFEYWANEGKPWAKEKIEMIDNALEKAGVEL